MAGWVVWPVMLLLDSPMWTSKSLEVSPVLRTGLCWETRRSGRLSGSPGKVAEIVRAVALSSCRVVVAGGRRPGQVRSGHEQCAVWPELWRLASSSTGGQLSVPDGSLPLSPGSIYFCSIARPVPCHGWSGGCGAWEEDEGRWWSAILA